MEILQRQPFADGDAGNPTRQQCFIQLHLIIGTNGISALVKHDEAWVMVKDPGHPDPLP
jgi:hypothetical protein